MSRWDEIDRPLLDAIHRAELANPPGKDIDGNPVIEELGIGFDEFKRSVIALEDYDLVDAILDYDTVVLRRVRPEGLIALGEWPSEERLAEVLPEVLRELAELAGDEDTATIYRHAGNFLEGVATSTVATVIKTLILGL